MIQTRHLVAKLARKRVNVKRKDAGMAQAKREADSVVTLRTPDIHNPVIIPACDLRQNSV